MSSIDPNGLQKRKKSAQTIRKDVPLMQRKRGTDDSAGAAIFNQQKQNPAMHHKSSDNSKEEGSESKAYGSTKAARQNERKEKEDAGEQEKERKKEKYPVHDSLKKRLTRPKHNKELLFLCLVNVQPPREKSNQKCGKRGVGLCNNQTNGRKQEGLDKTERNKEQRDNSTGDS